MERQPEKKETKRLLSFHLTESVFGSQSLFPPNTRSCGGKALRSSSLWPNRERERGMCDTYLCNRLLSSSPLLTMCSADFFHTIYVTWRVYKVNVEELKARFFFKERHKKLFLGWCQGAAEPGERSSLRKTSCFLFSKLDCTHHRVSNIFLSYFMAVNNILQILSQAQVWFMLKEHILYITSMKKRNAFISHFSWITGVKLPPTQLTVTLL